MPAMRRSKGKGPVTRGQIKTGFPSVPQATPKRASTRNGVASGYPAGMGVGNTSNKAGSGGNSTSKRPKRSKMY